MKSSETASTKEERFVSSLLAWFQQNKRSFPWRTNASAYAIALAEITLQKTSAANALPIYEKLITMYPTVEALAQADFDALSEIVRPLGLPRRARLLHELAQDVVSNYGGQFPLSEAELQKLPGIGPYGAGAIASQAHGLPVPMIDRNVMRIFERVFSVPSNIRSGPSRRLREFVIGLMPRGREAEFNLALLDFGALVCRTRHPLCQDCPLAEFCDYNLAGHCSQSQ